MDSNDLNWFLWGKIEAARAILMSIRGFGSDEPELAAAISALGRMETVLENAIERAQAEQGGAAGPQPQEGGTAA